MKRLLPYLSFLTVLVPTAAFAQGEPAPAAAAPVAVAAADVPLPTPRFSLSLERVAGVSYAKATQDSSPNAVSGTFLTLGGISLNPLGLPRVGFDYLFDNGLTLGGAVGFAHMTGTSTDSGGSSDVGSATYYSITPRVGYRFVASRRFDIVPRAGATFVGGSLKAPDGTACTFSQTGGESCKAVEGDSVGLNAIALTLEVLAVARVTDSFNILGGVTYDDVLSASTNDAHSHSNGTRETENDPVKGGAYALQLWFGVGGYL